MSRQAEIILKIDLDENNLTDKISWQASDQKEQGFIESEAFFLSLLDTEKKQLLAFHLRKKDLPVQEMSKLLLQSILSMADTYSKATGNQEVNEDIRKFVLELGEKLLPSDKK